MMDDGTYYSIHETQTNRYFLVQEMVELLSSNSFMPLKWFSGFTDGEVITDETWHIVAVSRKVD
ncbi:MAG: hypothetical protein ACE14P_06615 [Methanotrichaceae archaeon]